MRKLDAVACPKCGNTTDQDGLTYCYLEWRVIPVQGTRDGKIHVAYEDGESAHVDDDCPVLAVANTPVVTPEADHFHCNRCDWNWHDARPLH